MSNEIQLINEQCVKIAKYMFSKYMLDQDAGMVFMEWLDNQAEVETSPTYSQHTCSSCSKKIPASYGVNGEATPGQYCFYCYYGIMSDKDMAEKEYNNLKKRYDNNFQQLDACIKSKSHLCDQCNVELADTCDDCMENNMHEDMATHPVAVKANEDDSVEAVTEKVSEALNPPFYCAANIDQVPSDSVGKEWEFSDYGKEWEKGFLEEINSLDYPDGLFRYYVFIDGAKSGLCSYFMRPIQPKPVKRMGVEEAISFVMKEISSNEACCLLDMEKVRSALSEKLGCEVILDE